MKLQTLLLTVLSGGAISDELSLDFTDGDTLQGWDAGTFSIASNRVVNNPSLGAELFDPDAQTFVGTSTYAWQAAGSNTISNVSNELNVVYVNNAQGGFAQLRNAGDLTQDLANAHWYRYEANAYRLVGNAALYVRDTSINDIINFMISGSSKQSYKSSRPVYNGNNIFIYLSELASGRTAIIDDQSLKEITLADMFAVVPAAYRINGPVVVRAAILAENTDRTNFAQGVFVCLDSKSNPQNFVAAWIDRMSNLDVKMAKVVNGVMTSLITADIAFADNGILTIERPSTNSFQLWYNGAQVGTTQTINDASIVSNTLHGYFSAGGGVHGMTRFYIAPDLMTTKLAFVGGSITVFRSWADNVVDSIRLRDMNRRTIFIRAALNGQTSWDAAFRLASEIFANNPNFIFLDHAANNQNTDIYTYQLEGQIRRIRTEQPNAFLIAPIFPYWLFANNLDTTVSNSAVMTTIRNLCTHYDVYQWDVHAYMLANFGGGLDTWYSSPDGVHPDTPGDVVLGNQLLAILTAAFLNSTAPQWTGDLADYARINSESQYFEGTPIARNGTANDGETGTWTTVATTARTSSVADSTITWTGTFSSWGLDTTNGSPGGVPQGTIAWSIDGGAETQINLAARTDQPYLISGYLGAAASHTIVIRNVSGTTRINRFLAI